MFLSEFALLSFVIVLIVLNCILDVVSNPIFLEWEAAIRQNNKLVLMVILLCPDYVIGLTLAKPSKFKTRPQKWTRKINSILCSAQGSQSAQASKFQ